MKVPGITIPDVPEAGKIDGDEMLLVLENSELRLKTIDMAKGVYRFPDFSPRLLASLAASSTAACTSGVVTVTATSHGVIATAFDGFEFYYPGSPSLAAGWYANFARTGADTCTFSAPFAVDFTSESINSGDALVDEITVASIVLPANTMKPGDLVRARLAINQDATSNSRVQKLKLGTTTMCATTNATATSSCVFSLTFSVVSKNKQFGVTTRDHNVTSGEYYGTEDISTDLTVSFTTQLAAAGCYSAFSSLKLLIQ